MCNNFESTFRAEYYLKVIVHNIWTYRTLYCLVVVISKLGSDLGWGRRYTSVQVNEDSSGLETPESGISLGGYESKYELSENLWCGHYIIVLLHYLCYFLSLCTCMYIKIMRLWHFFVFLMAIKPSTKPYRCYTMT